MRVNGYSPSCLFFVLVQSRAVVRLAWFIVPFVLFAELDFMICYYVGKAYDERVYCTIQCGD